MFNFVDQNTTPRGIRHSSQAVWLWARCVWVLARSRSDIGQKIVRYDDGTLPALSPDGGAVAKVAKPVLTS
jgi:hypothetical protein